jgi:hypothetical protein
MMVTMAQQEKSNTQFRQQAIEHLQKLAAQLKEEEAELSRPNDSFENRVLEDGRQAAAAAAQAAQRLSTALGDA